VRFVSGNNAKAETRAWPVHANRARMPDNGMYPDTSSRVVQAQDTAKKNLLPQGTFLLGNNHNRAISPKQACAGQRIKQ
jgi:hypothetical protein